MANNGVNGTVLGQKCNLQNNVKRKSLLYLYFTHYTTTKVWKGICQSHEGNCPQSGEGKGTTRTRTHSAVQLASPILIFNYLEF